jgi:hypothetical protein
MYVDDFPGPLINFYINKLIKGGGNSGSPWGARGAKPLDLVLARCWFFPSLLAQTQRRPGRAPYFVA